MPPVDDWLYGQTMGAKLAGLQPGVSTPVTAFVASVRTEVTRLRVCNISTGNRTFQIYHNSGGGAAATANALWFNFPCASSAVFDWGAGSQNAGISMDPGDNLMVRSDATDGLTFTFYGVSSRQR